MHAPHLGLDPSRSDAIALVAGVATIAAVAVASGLVIAQRAGAGEASANDAVHVAALVAFTLGFAGLAGPWRRPWTFRDDRVVLAACVVAPRPDALTPRETEVVRLLAGGFSNKEIARALDVAEGTAKNHVSSVLDKLDVRDRTRAVLKAIDLGLI